MNTLSLETKPGTTTRLAELVRQVIAEVPFYTNKYRDTAMDFQSFDMETFERLPFFTRGEYRRQHPDDLYYPLDESHYVFISGGSTGIAKASFWNISYINNQVTTLADTFRSLGITPDHRAMNLFTPGMSGTHYGFNLALEQTGSTIVPLGGDSELPVIARFIKDLRVNLLIGNPATLILVLEYLAAEEPGFSLDTIIYAGENLSRVQYDFMKRHARHIYSPIYSSTETGIIGTQCPHVPAGAFHLADTVYVELLDPAGGVLTGENEGEIVVTSLLERSAPCIRYRLGDRVTFLDTPCSCGHSGRLFRLQGRVDDAVTIGSTNWSYDEIVTPLLEHLEYPPDISCNFCLVLEEDRRKVRMTVRFQPAGNAGDDLIRRLEEKMNRFFNEEHPVVSPLVQKKIIYPVVMERIESFEPLRNPRTGKLRPVIDHRRN
jgi:phenylacetate-CoA ligase